MILRVNVYTSNLNECTKPYDSRVRDLVEGGVPVHASNGASPHDTMLHWAASFGNGEVGGWMSPRAVGSIDRRHHHRIELRWTLLFLVHTHTCLHIPR